MSSGPMMSMVKGAALGMAAGLAVGYISKKTIDENPKMKRKEHKAMQALESLMDTAQYMFK